MSTVVTNNVVGSIDFTTNGVTAFLGLVGPSITLLGLRVGIGHGELAGMLRVTASVPGGGAGTLTIEQSVDGTNYDLVNTFLCSIAGGTVPFSIKIHGRFIRARYTLAPGVTQDIRFGAILRPVTSP